MSFYERSGRGVYARGFTGRSELIECLGTRGIGEGAGEGVRRERVSMRKN